MIYCVVPQELADELYDQMVAHYRDNPNVTVIIDRREGANRRSRIATDEAAKRREIRERRRARVPGTFPGTENPDTA
jgi:hypothetical protein